MALFETGCLGPCAVGPVAVVYPEGTFYQNLTAKDAAQIVKEHLAGGRIVERGKHEDLLAAGGIYASIYDLQFRHQEEAAPALAAPPAPAGGHRPQEGGER